jgi:hypothetical protein
VRAAQRLCFGRQPSRLRRAQARLHRGEVMIRVSVPGMKADTHFAATARKAEINTRRICKDQRAWRAQGMVRV